MIAPRFLHGIGHDQPIPILARIALFELESQVLAIPGLDSLDVKGMAFQALDENRLLQLFANSATESNAIGRQGDIGLDLSLHDQGEYGVLRIIGFYGKSFAQGGPASIAGIDHNADNFLAAGTDMPRIRGDRATSVGSDVLYHQRGCPMIFNHKIMLNLNTFENRGENMFHLGNHRTGVITPGCVPFARGGLLDGLPGKGTGSR